MGDPATEYHERLEKWTREREQVERRSDRISNFRLLLFTGAVGTGIAALLTPSVSPLWLFLPLAGFVSLVLYHQGILTLEGKAARAIDYYRLGGKRIAGDWSPEKNAPSFYDPKHPFAVDLDIVAPPEDRSLVHLVSAARTPMGGRQLVDWLTDPPERSGILDRQESVKELRGNVDLFEELGLLESKQAATIRPDQLKTWVAHEPFFSDERPKWAARALSLAAAVALGLLVAGISPFPLLGVIGLLFLYTNSLKERMKPALQIVEECGHHLLILQQVLDLVEKREFKGRLLQEVKSGLQREGSTPSEEVRRARLLIHRLLNSRRNQVLVIVSALFLRWYHLMFALEDWRLSVGKELPAWLDAAGRFEALASLARHGYEHPGDPFPEIAEEGTVLHADELGHPMMKEEACVRNNVRIDAGRRLLLVSGSNMAGKSTFLRTIGINAAMAFAGGTVRASKLRISPLRLGASIRIIDSLEEGRSRFFSELQRIREILDRSKEGPVLYFLDEILHGTNSKDRHTGAQAVLKTLLGNGAIGLITTHDLSLCELAEELGEGVINVHFRDEFADGKMTFDYTLREGIVPKSNAIELMRSMGMDV